MRYAFVLFLLLTSVVALSRKKRYLVFPEGSTIAVEVNQNTRLVPDVLSDWVCIQSVDTSLQLPSEADLFLHKKKLKKKQKKKSRRKDKWRRHRRDRRQLYSRLDDLLYSLGLDGTACVRRALCEAAEREAPTPGSHLLREALHLIFSPPAGAGEELGRYRPGEDCHLLAQACPISLLEPLLMLPSSHAVSTLSLS
ncbi:uncharacterized protein LOC126282284 [Schistocerca gregaria]|uniref:uncharacterized protein LOC126282284 n=1 Tax=Schistocerca gregaria TaxID=7010 RepID=UPI00211EFE11|nr:uncharacterized protein LOC126282284 [Schistocerca gregaria]